MSVQEAYDALQVGYQIYYNIINKVTVQGKSKLMDFPWTVTD